MPAYKFVHLVVAAVALLATIVLAWDLVARARFGNRWAAARTISLALVGLISLASWWNFGLAHYGRYIHVHEFFHYYLGAKYHHELGYTELYRCVVAADVEAAHSSTLSKRWVRDLATNTLERGTDVAAQREECLARFTPARWQSFTRDVAWLRGLVNDEKWGTLQTDHGFNATPVWTMSGSLLANLAPASDRSMLALALIDPVLILVMWALAWWAFGWRGAAVAAVWWGTNLASRFSWTGGAFLRADWLLLTVASLCFMKRDRPMLSGFALGWATLLRLFPALIGIGLLLNELVRWRQAGRISPTFTRFLAGGALAMALLVPMSSLVLSGRLLDVSDWRAFAENTRKHLSTPLTNHVGLKTIVAFEPSSRAALNRDLWLDSPWDAWKAARERVFRRREPVFWIVVGAFVALLARAVRGEEPWVALALGLAIIPVAAELTSYYWSVLLGFGFLWLVRPWVGVALAATSTATCVMALLPMDDDRFFAVSVLVVVFSMAVTCAWAFRSRPARTHRRENGAAA